MALLQSIMFDPEYVPPAFSGVDTGDPELREAADALVDARDRTQQHATAEKLAAAFCADAKLDQALTAAYGTIMPAADVRLRYRQHFMAFKDYCASDGVTAVPARGATVATYLLHLAVVEGRPLAELQEHASAIDFYLNLERRAWGEAALKIIAGLGDDGGGLPETETETAIEVHADTNAPVPLAAEAPQQLST